MKRVNNKKNKCDKMVKLKEKIRKYIPNEKIHFEHNIINNKWELYFDDHNSMIAIDKNTDWSKTKRNIDLKINPKINKTCDICEETEMMEIRRISCPECSNEFCLNCYVNIFRQNQGLIICPYCRFEYGELKPPILIELGIKEIYSSAGIDYQMKELEGSDKYLNPYLPVLFALQMCR